MCVCSIVCLSKHSVDSCVQYQYLWKIVVSQGKETPTLIEAEGCLEGYAGFWSVLLQVLPEGCISVGFWWLVLQVLLEDESLGPG